MSDPFDKPDDETFRKYQIIIRVMRRFQTRGAPLAFQWLEWCAVLSVIMYVEIRTGYWALTTLKWILYFLLWGYYIAFFTQFRSDWIPKDELLSRRALLDWTLALGATLAMLCSSSWFAEMFMRFSK